MQELEPHSEVVQRLHDQLSAALSHADDLQAWFNDMIGSADPEKFEQMRQQVVGELNAMWPVMRTEIQIEGVGLHPQFSGSVGDGNLRAENVWGNQPSTPGLHEGFDVLKNEFTGRYEVMHKVTVARDMYVTDRTKKTMDEYYSYFDLESVYVIPGEVSGMYYENSDRTRSEPYNFVKSRSFELRQIMASAEFAELSDRQQTDSIQAFVAATEADSGLRNAELQLEGRKIWIPRPGERAVHISPLDISKYAIAGSFMGLESADALTAPGGIIVDTPPGKDTAVEGIWLVLDPDKDTRKVLELEDWQVVYFPTEQDELREDNVVILRD